MTPCYPINSHPNPLDKIKGFKTITFRLFNLFIEMERGVFYGAGLSNYIITRIFINHVVFFYHLSAILYLYFILYVYANWNQMALR